MYRTRDREHPPEMADNHGMRTVTTPHSAAPTRRIEDLISMQVAGHALGGPFYTDPAIFEQDLERMLLRHWFCAGHASTIARPGDYLVVDLGRESVIVIRTAEGEVRALLNVCRHRGSRVCTTATGRATVGRLTCPYHAWSYDLDGRLVTARQMPPDFDPARHALRQLPVRVAEGLVFTSFAECPPDFAGAADALAKSAGVHGWGRAKVAHRETYSIVANWKLAVENYMECYHCQPAHPEFARRHVYARPARQTEELEAAGRARAAALGIVIEDRYQYGLAGPPGGESVSIFRSALYEGLPSAAADDRPLAPLMGAFRASDGNTTYFDIGPLSSFLGYPDHGVIYRFIPRAAELTEMEVIWLVDEDAVAGRDYDVARLTWLWHTTSLEDKRIVELNHAGVASRYFVPGPYSLQEPYARAFAEWYLAELARP
jgi:Rieske 2Fe-2S family protein